MYKKTMTYTDFNGEERTEDFYFNLTKAEIMEMELGTAGGLTGMIQKIISEKDQPKIVEMFKALILKAYGVKSPDGKRFMKKQNGVNLCEEFEQTEAYSDLFILLATDAEAATEFVNNVIPKAEEAQQTSNIPAPPLVVQ